MFIEPVHRDDPALARFVAHAKAEMWAIGVAEAARLTPPPFADYLGLFVEGELAGFVEVFCYAQTCGSYAKSPWGDACDLGAFCGPEQMMHVEAIFVERRYRRSSRHFARLYLSAARHYRARGARFATVLVDAADVYLVGLYRKIGAREICSLARLPWFEARGIELGLFVLDLQDVIDGRIARRFERTARNGRPGIEERQLPEPTLETHSRKRLALAEHESSRPRRSTA